MPCSSGRTLMEVAGIGIRQYAASPQTLYECRPEPTVGAGRPRNRPPWWDRPKGIPPVVKLASHGARRIRWSTERTPAFSEAAE